MHATGLYITTFLIDLICLVGRWLVIGIVITPLVGNTGQRDVFAFLLAAIPEVLSLRAFFGTGNLDSERKRQSLGARRASNREKAIIEATLAPFLAQPGVIAPGKIWVIDRMTESNAQVYGTTLFIYSGLVDSEFLAPVLAHELGHLKRGDGRAIAALDALSIPGASAAFFWLLGMMPGIGSKITLPVIIGLILVTICSAGVVTLVALSIFLTFALCLFLGTGGLPMLVMGRAWEGYFRDKAEYAADDFAADLGQAPKLLEYLDKYQLFDVSVPWNKGKTHPPIELRKERLRQRAGITTATPSLAPGVPPGQPLPTVLPPVAAQQLPGPAQSAQMTRFCDQCAAENRMKAKYCWRCGEPLPVIPAP